MVLAYEQVYVLVLRNKGGETVGKLIQFSLQKRKLKAFVIKSKKYKFTCSDLPPPSKPRSALHRGNAIDIVEVGSDSGREKMFK
ncbi:hypothetical protein EVAR_87567_1 [Eumeta japonica]|uniref:Uncharacterized protein n=1 Tax=Eumeta variegata TaxID=151549 RepID=A0A4C1WNT1_EUMVA|nr:hypothetical protein EVAR_87567_1 [Eumeta japonica]